MEYPKLYDLLKDEHKAKLQEEQTKFPHLVGRVINELKEQEFILSCSFLTIMDLTQYLTNEHKIDFLMVKDFFYEYDYLSKLKSNE